MGDDRLLRKEIRLPLDIARTRIRRHTGLYPDEDLTRDVLSVCDEVLTFVAMTPTLRDAREAVEACCIRLSQVSDRFSERNLAAISKARAQAVAAIDRLQDVLLERRRFECRPRVESVVLRQRSR
ncbi:hypothetical protein [Microvirga subterranea]|uniref:Uncharacterized protein n=1 Tax=Microvirga subterranea TaxID=186651 RepID=A0A370HID6_9HYPH|nr:hypothetical protein [Microvirga subterranea]RDI57923.1 hypothetical protein DES45_106237 [Microvirga subterranea]